MRCSLNGLKPGRYKIPQTKLPNAQLELHNYITWLRKGATTLRRYLETAFRHKVMFLFPVIVVPGLIVAMTLVLGNQSEIRAIIWVEPRYILTGGALDTMRPPPNRLEALAMTERVSTEAFRMELMDRTGLAAAIRAGQWPQTSKLQTQLNSSSFLRPLASVLGMRIPASIDEALDMGLKRVLDSIKVTDIGSNLLAITYTGSDLDFGQSLIDETIRLYNETTLDSRTQEADASVAFLTGKLDLQRQRLDAAVQALQEFLAFNPPPLPGQSRPPEEDAELRDLEQVRDLELQLYTTAQERLDSVRVSGEGATSARDLTLQVIDPAVIPDDAGVKPSTLGMMGLMGMTLGAILGLVPIVLLTWRDGTVRTMEDVEAAINVPSIVEVPLVPSASRKEGVSLLRIAAGWTPRVGDGS